MKVESQIINLRAQNPPTVEIDTEGQAVYVRFRKTKVAKTVERPSKNMFITIDLDSSNEVVGIEFVGATNFNIHTLLGKADLKCPKIDETKVRYVPAAVAA